jgi:uncharacterized membrane protein YkoI
MRTLFPLLFLGTTLAPFGATAQNGACFSDWSAASVIVRNESLVTVEQLTKLAPTKLGGEIVRTTLCEGTGGYIYKVVVRNSAGHVKNVVLDARHPFP